MTKDEALKLALEALEVATTPLAKDRQEVLRARAAIREALAQPDVDRRSTESKETFDQQEPVAYLDEGLGAFYWAKDYKKHVGFKPLYTTPPHRKPLTDVEIWNTYKNLWMFHPAEEPRLAGDVLKFARAIEQAHGIKE